MKLLLCLLLIHIIYSAEALKCYVCSATEGDFDAKCIDNPELVDGAVRTCDKKYCISQRQEYLSPKDQVKGIFRSCADKGDNDVIEDYTYRTYMRACQEDLCNGGTGKDTTGQGSLHKEKEAGILYVQGRPKSHAAQLKPFTILVFGIIFIFTKNL